MWKASTCSHAPVLPNAMYCFFVKYLQLKFNTLESLCRQVALQHLNGYRSMWTGSHLPQVSYHQCWAWFSWGSAWGSDGNQTTPRAHPPGGGHSHGVARRTSGQQGCTYNAGGGGNIQSIQSNSVQQPTVASPIATVHWWLHSFPYLSILQWLPAIYAMCAPISLHHTIPLLHLLTTH